MKDFILIIVAITTGVVIGYAIAGIELDRTMEALAEEKKMHRESAEQLIELRSSVSQGWIMRF